MKGIISTSVLAFLLATVAEAALFEGGPCIRSDGLRGSCSSSCQPSCSSSIAEDICGYRGLKADDVITCCLKPGENPRFKATIKAYPNLDGICNHYHRNKTLSCLGSTPVKPFDSGTFDPHTHLAAIGWSNLNGVSWRCTGTLISDRHVVASAHCLADQLNSPDTIRMGASELNNFPDGGDYGIKRVIYHAEYDPSESYNDLVVLEIVKKNPRDTSVHLPACIWTHQDLKTRAASAYGYGNGSPQKIESESSEIIDTYLCRFSYTKDDFIPTGLVETQVCGLSAGKNAEKSADCNNFPSKPLVIANVNVPFLVGVSSFRKSCEAEVPTVYTRIFSYVDWLEEIVGS